MKIKISISAAIRKTVPNNQNSGCRVGIGALKAQFLRLPADLTLAAKEGLHRVSPKICPRAAAKS
jgi:hypothetical protein